MISNINRHIPARTDKIFVDTNIWFWITYAASKELSNTRYQTRVYPEFIEKVLNEGASLYHCPLILSELANIIERTEWGIFKSSNDNELSRKQYRKIESEREKVMIEIESAWSAICEVSTCLDLHMNKKFADDSFIILSSSKLDPYDAFYFKLMEQENITQILTDDGDFSTTTVGTIFTANDRMLQQ
jgi:predicted nucleic acid-binding protein